MAQFQAMTLLAVLLAAPAATVNHKKLPSPDAQPEPAPATFQQASFRTDFPSPPLGHDSLQRVGSWAYQLQDPDPAALARVPHDLLVIDYSRDGSDDGAFSRSEIAAMKLKPDGSRRIVLAYLSIGEAEEYRAYWQEHWKQRPPEWLGSENREWCGNYPVRFWHPEWKRIILHGAEHQPAYLDKIIGAGFDGIYLDRVDVYAELEAVERSARDQMIAFVEELSRSAKSRAGAQHGGQFFVVAQNAEELLEFPHYRASIDGLGKEDLLFNAGGEGRTNPPAEVAESVRLIGKLLKEKKPVFAVEYLSSARAIDTARSRLASLGMVPYFAPRALDSLSTTAPNDNPVSGSSRPVRATGGC